MADEEEPQTNRRTTRYGAQAEFNRLRRQGITLPSEPVRARLAARELVSSTSSPGSLSTAVAPYGIPSEGRSRLNKFSSNGGRAYDQNKEVMGKFAQRRSATTGFRKQGAAFGTDAQWAWPKMHDPFEYWREKTWWWDMEDPEEQQRKISDWCRLMYSTHYLVPSCIDIYTRFPLLDIEFVHPDRQIVQFYEELFMDGLDYEEFLFDMGREFWTVGEAFPLGSWHDGIGAWEADELINPNDVVVAKNRALRTYTFHVKVPEQIKKLIDTREPYSEYQTLVQLYPDVIQWAREDTEIPVSDILMKQLRFKSNPWTEHGNPILLRAFRTLMLEETLNAAQDAIADRLYSPLILATLGLPDVDQDGPWIPDQAELQALRDDLAMAINADFRMMVYHHGLDIKNAFGRETMPNMSQDFERVEAKTLQVFGISPELLQGGQSQSTYASGALNRELITQMLKTYQVYIKKFMKERMEPVAERQGHYEYRKVGGQRIPEMENVLVVDEETGEEYVEERPKLAVPEVKFKSMNLRDEQIEREFLGQLAAAGFPLSLSTQAVNIPIDFDEELETRQDEKIKSVVAEQQFKQDLWQRLTAQGLPIPLEYMEEYQMYMQTGMGANPEALAQYSPEAIADLSNPVMTPNMGGPLSEMGPEGGEGTTNEMAPPPDVSLPGEEGGSMGGPEESYEMAGQQPIMAKKVESILDPDFEYDYEQLEPIAKYGNRMAFGTPHEFRRRIKSKLPKGIKVAKDDDIEHFDFDQFQRELEAHKRALAANANNDEVFEDEKSDELDEDGTQT